MTTEELNAAIEKNLKQYNKDAAELRKNWLLKDQEVLNEWASEHAGFSIGDAIKYSDGDTVISVEQIYGMYSKYKHAPYVAYYGTILTKQLKPKKVNGGKFSLYEEGMRQIVKVK